MCAQLNSGHTPTPEKEDSKNSLWLRSSHPGCVFAQNVLLLTLHCFLWTSTGERGCTSVKLFCWCLPVSRWVYLCCVWLLNVCFWVFSKFIAAIKYEFILTISKIKMLQIILKPPIEQQNILKVITVIILECSFPNLFLCIYKHVPIKIQLYCFLHKCIYMLFCRPTMSVCVYIHIPVYIHTLVCVYFMICIQQITFPYL